MPSVSAVDPSRYILTVVQGGTPFPSRDSLIGPTNVSLPYTQHVANMFMVSERGWRIGGERLSSAQGSVI